MKQQLQNQPSAHKFASQPLSTNSAGKTDAFAAYSNPERLPGLTDEAMTMGAVARSLRRRSPVRDFALNALAGTPSINVQPLLDALADHTPRRWKEHVVAAWLLGKLPLQSEQTQAATQRLCEVVGTRQSNTGLQKAKHTGRRTVRALSVPAMAALTITLFFIVTTLLRDGPASRSFAVWFTGFLISIIVYTLVLTPLVMPVSVAYNKKRINRARAAAAVALGRKPDRQCVGVLARAALDKNRQVREAADAALRVALPTLTPEHHGQTSADDIGDLCRLMFRVDEPLALQILDALSKVGDSSAISHVTRLAERGCTHRVRETAAALLPLLHQRKEEENAHRMLLRASSVTPTGLDVLLRPAHSVTGQSAGEMVRPSHAPNGEAMPLAEENAAKEDANISEARPCVVSPANV